MRIGTRGSALALRQTDIAIEALRRSTDAEFESAAASFEVVPISTKGDRDKVRSFDVLRAELGPKGIFAAELQRALLDDEIDVAVHSLKDLTGAELDGLVLAAILEREDARDVLVSRDGLTLAELPSGAVIGTSSVRRQALLAGLRPDVSTVPLRGNVDTRLRKVADGDVAAAILAAAGIVRLDRADEITEWLDPLTFVPPPGQGAIAIEALTSRVGADLAWIGGADHAPTRRCVEAERAFMRIVEGSCDVPLGAWARLEGDEIVLDGFLVAGKLIRAQAHGTDPESVGLDLANKLT